MTTFSEMSCALGTMISAPSQVPTTVARMPICLHLAAGVADREGVSHPDRPLEEQDQPRHEVVDDVLQAEAHAHAEGAHDDRDLADVEAGRHARDYRARQDHHVPREPRDRLGHPRGRSTRGMRSTLRTNWTRVRDLERQPDDEAEDQEIAGIDGDLADRDRPGECPTHGGGEGSQEEEAVEGREHPKEDRPEADPAEGGGADGVGVGGRETRSAGDVGQEERRRIVPRIAPTVPTRSRRRRPASCR